MENNIAKAVSGSLLKLFPMICVLLKIFWKYDEQKATSVAQILTRLADEIKQSWNLFGQLINIKITPSLISDIGNMSVISQKSIT